jgi:hypothetical protein
VNTKRKDTARKAATEVANPTARRRTTTNTSRREAMATMKANTRKVGNY